MDCREFLKWCQWWKGLRGQDDLQARCCGGGALRRGLGIEVLASYCGTCEASIGHGAIPVTGSEPRRLRAVSSASKSEGKPVRMGGGTRHVIDKIGADSLALQLPHVGRGETEMFPVAVEVIDDRAFRYVGP